MIIDVLGKNNEFGSSNDDIENETLDQSSDDEVESSKTAIVEDVEDDMENNLEEKK